jgi:hypothetical protein
MRSDFTSIDCATPRILMSLGQDETVRRFDQLAQSKETTEITIALRQTARNAKPQSQRPQNCQVAGWQIPTEVNFSPILNASTQQQSEGESAETPSASLSRPCRRTSCCCQHPDHYSRADDGDDTTSQWSFPGDDEASTKCWLCGSALDAARARGVSLLRTLYCDTHGACSPLCCHAIHVCSSNSACFGGNLTPR